MQRTNKERLFTRVSGDHLVPSLQTYSKHIRYLLDPTANQIYSIMPDQIGLARPAVVGEVYLGQHRSDFLPKII